MNFAREHMVYQISASGSVVKNLTPVISEQPVSITVNGDIWVTLMCTPLQLEALAVGFLFNEGVIQDFSAVESIRICPTVDNVDIWLGFSVQKPSAWYRTSGCAGGQTSVAVEAAELDSDDTWEKENGFSLPPDNFRLSPRQVIQLTSALFESQEVYKQTGGVHTSALSDGEKILLASEDVGRHNTLDKIAGRCLIENIAPSHKVLLTTGRISSEMLQKTSRLKAPVIISRTAPTSLSIQLAQKRNITLIGYARRNQFNVYSHPERIEVDKIMESSL